MRVLGDVIVVEHLEPYESSLIHIPDAKDNPSVGLIKARVLHVGQHFRHKDDVKPNDIVLVPSQFGTRLPQKHWQSKLPIVYDGEDVYALVTS